MKILKVTIVTLLLLCAFNSYAREPITLHVGGWSHHWAFSNNITNETHKVLGAEYKGVAAGYFENSYGRDTVFLLKTWRYQWKENVEISTALGINYGYVECYGSSGDSSKVCLDGFVGISYTEYPVIPSLKLKPGVIIFAPEIRF